MKNAEILIKSLTDWATPIIEKSMSSGNSLGFLSQIISPQYFINSTFNNLGLPVAKKYIEKIPDEVIPNFSLDLIDGMIETRKENGELFIPVLNAGITPDALKNLKKICEDNFEQYGAKSDEEDSVAYDIETRQPAKV